MKTCTRFAWLAAIGAVGVFNLYGQTPGDAVLLRLDDATQQVRVEALDTATGRWLAIASGYRDAADAGWLKIALPEGYSSAQLRVLASAAASPFAGMVESAMTAAEQVVDYPAPDNRYTVDALSPGAGGEKSEPVIEEADIWAWEGNVLYFYNQYRGLQVIDMTDPLAPAWLDYHRYPAKGEDLYALGGGRVLLIGTGNYWMGDKLTIQFMNFDGSHLSAGEAVPLEGGYYMDSRRYGDFLYVMTREWVYELDPAGRSSQTPRIRLYTVALRADAPQRVVDVKSFEGDGWLDAVLTAQPDGILLSLNKYYQVSLDWRWHWRSEVHVLVPGEDGVPAEVGTAKLAGIVHDKYKMNFSDGLLTTISQQVDWSTGQFSRATKLENFTLTPTGFVRAGALDLAPGETLFASRFYGDTIYIVTFLFVDPLFAIDNSDPAKPFIAGELMVPGYSNYIEWVDNRLFAVGIEANRLTVSSFDVADPANMALTDRVYLNEDSWAYSEAQYDDQAISFFPQAKLIMLPFTTWSWKSSEMIQAMQLISWDDLGKLQLRGQIQHIDVPRRGVLDGTTVVTISGRQVVTTDVTNPDTPAEGGSATLAWNVQHLIPHADYFLELEAPESTYVYWRSPYSPSAAADPVLYVTTRDEPNIAVAEVTLAPGRLLGAAHAGNRLVLLQDITAMPDTSYYSVPEKQSLAVRVYDLADPLAPVLTGEGKLEGVAFLGNVFNALVLPEGAVLWASKSQYYDYYIMRDAAMIWPGYAPSTLSYLVSTITPDGAVSIPAHALYSDGNYWSRGSGWFWEPPVLLSSICTYEQHLRPDKVTDYISRTRLVAVDFTSPAEPVELPPAKLPGNLVAADSLPDALNHFLYFEPQWNMVEVWGWDRAAAFPLFRQKLYPDDTANGYSYSFGWMPPFHMRNRYRYATTPVGVTASEEVFLDAWRHERTLNRFAKIGEFGFENRWINDKAVMEPYFLASAYDQIHMFKGDAATGAFDLLDSLDIPFPNLYTADLDKAVLTDAALHVPAGIYGVDTLPIAAVPGPQSARLTAQAEATAWTMLDASRWQLAAKASSDAAGIISSLQWLFHPDSMPEPDPLARDAGDLWRDSAWFGWYAHLSQHPSYISHLEHGTLWVSAGPAAESQGFFLHDAKLGYLWSRHGTYPFLYSYSRGQWLYYLKGTGTGGTRWFYDYATGWFTVGG